MRLCLAVATLVAAGAAGAQPVLTREPSTGAYTITYTDEAGIVRRVSFEGEDRVSPLVSLTIDGTQHIMYRYQIGNGGDAKQPLFSISIPCEQNSVSPAGAERIKVWDSVHAGRPGPLVNYCRWILGNSRQPGVPAGAQYTARPLILQSQWLPGIRQAEAVGVNSPVTFPGFRDEAPEAITNLYDSTQVPLKFGAMSPKYPPETMSDPFKGVAALLEELSQACSIGWVSPEGVCNSLKMKLTHAQEAAAKGDFAAESQRLDTFVSEIQAQAGKHVAMIFAVAMQFDAAFLRGALK